MPDRSARLPRRAVQELPRAYKYGGLSAAYAERVKDAARYECE